MGDAVWATDDVRALRELAGDFFEFLMLRTPIISPGTNRQRRVRRERRRGNGSRQGGDQSMNLELYLLVPPKPSRLRKSGGHHAELTMDVRQRC